MHTHVGESSIYNAVLYCCNDLSLPHYVSLMRMRLLNAHVLNRVNFDPCFWTMEQPSSSGKEDRESKVREFMKKKEEELQRSCQVDKKKEGIGNNSSVT